MRLRSSKYLRAADRCLAKLLPRRLHHALRMAALDRYYADYQRWVDRHVLTEAARQELRAAVSHWRSPPLISVLTPVYNVPERYLRAAIESVRGQIYPHWELCVGEDASTDPRVDAVLREYAAADPRVKVAFRPTNGGISAATNSALELARGEFAALLDGDDLLAEHALARCAQALVADPTIDMLYTDEDKISEAGRRLAPFFKPDWSPEYLLGCMYTCHLGVYRTAILRQIGKFRSQFDYSQDYDMVLRFSRVARKIHHIPEVLYHWRMLPHSTSWTIQAKPKAHGAGRRAIQDFLDSGGTAATVLDGPSPGSYDVRFAIRARPKVSIIVSCQWQTATIARRRTWSVLRCLQSILQKSNYPRVEIFLAALTEIPAGLNSALHPFPHQVIAGTAAGGSLLQAINRAAEVATGEHLLFLIESVEARTPDWIERMLEYSQHDEIAAVGAKLLTPRGLIWHLGIAFVEGTPVYPFRGCAGRGDGYFHSAAVARNVSAVSGACLMTRRQVFAELGGFSKEFSGGGHDIDYCLRALAGKRRIVLAPRAELIEHASAAELAAAEPQRQCLQRRWPAAIPRDPYYNPTLSKAGADHPVSG